MLNYLDDLEQRSLLGSISINIQDPILKARVGVKKDGDYNNIDVNVLTEGIVNRYKVTMGTDDISSA